MLAKISIVCFAASYAVALLLEISRLFFRLPVRHVVMLGFGVAGLIAQTIFLGYHGGSGTPDGVPFSSWHLWYLCAAWALAAAYVISAAARPQTALGIFLLPVVLGLIGAATFADQKQFPREQTAALWGMVHGLALLGGTVVTALGFVAGLMYLVQSYRLKHKLPPRAGFRLPSLETLQIFNRQALYYSSFLTASGLLAGVILNTIRRGVPWNDRVVISSSILLAWLCAASIFEMVYKPAQQGRKVAYLTVASFIFLAMVQGLLFFGDSKHGAPSGSKGELKIPAASEVQP